MDVELEIDSYINNTRVRAYALTKISEIIDKLYEDAHTLEAMAKSVREKSTDNDRVADKLDDERCACYELISFLSGVKV
nr:MAG: hypothetical protein [Bacteriophage sp.]